MGKLPSLPSSESESLSRLSGLDHVNSELWGLFELHPPIDLLADEGQFYKSGFLHVIWNVDIKPLEEIFWDQFLKFLIHEGRTKPEFSEKIIYND